MHLIERQRAYKKVCEETPLSWKMFCGGFWGWVSVWELNMLHWLLVVVLPVADTQTQWSYLTYLACRLSWEYSQRASGKNSRQAWKYSHRPILHLLCRVWLIDLRPYQHDNGFMAGGHRIRSTPTNGHSFTALSLPCSYFGEWWWLMVMRHTETLESDIV